MEGQNIYDVSARRTGGDIYIGVVGPVRTGKSTFIKRFMDTLVIPNIDSEYKKERATDELPQSSAGRTLSVGIYRGQRAPDGQNPVVRRGGPL